MLVLTRKSGEAIVIGHNIRVVISSVKGDKVRVAIEAPDDIVIHRSEVAAQIEAEEHELVCH